MSSAPPSVAPGMLVANRFRIDRQLGGGAMGKVFLGWHTTLNIPVAVKFIDTALADRGDLRSRFAQEAQSVAQIDSPHVVRVIDYGLHHDGRPYIAMELLRGESLAERLARERVLPLDLTARIVSQAARGLKRAHSRGIVHRDIKPENLYLAEDDDEDVIVKILDFGIAKTSMLTGKAHQTGTGHLLGTPLYMSPEQALGTKQVDFRTDLYSLAVVAYQCLTGHVPFESEGLGALIVAITGHPHTPVSTLRPDLGTAFDPWFEKTLAKDPAHRFDSAKTMAREFVELCKATHPRVATVALPATPVVSYGTWNETTGIRNRPAAPGASNVQPNIISQPASGDAAPAFGPTPVFGSAAGQATGDPSRIAGPHGTQISHPGVPYQQEVPTLEGASNTTPETQIRVPTHRSFVPWLLAAVLFIATGIGGLVWWVKSARDARLSAAAGLVASEAVTTSPPSVPPSPASIPLPDAPTADVGSSSPESLPPVASSPPANVPDKPKHRRLSAGSVAPQPPSTGKPRPADPPPTPKSTSREDKYAL